MERQTYSIIHGDVPFFSIRPVVSGPTTLAVTVDPVAILLNAAVLGAVTAYEAIESERQRAAQASVQISADQAALRQRRQEESAQGMATLHSQAQALSARLARIRESAQDQGLRDQLASCSPAAPAPNDLTGWLRHNAMLSALCDEGERIIRELPGMASAGGIAIASIASLAASPPHPQPSPDQSSTRERALALEASRQQQLQQKNANAQRLSSATATLMADALKDLGYEVESIAQTLFTEGGVVHFRRAQWGDYMVRMRVGDEGSSANFNVVRPADTKASAIDDHLAEDRWCAEFPRLMDVLSQRGVQLAVTRRLQAGELPVQTLEPHQLPRLGKTNTLAQEEEERYRASPLRSRRLG